MKVVWQQLITNIRKITNGFKTLYQDYKLIRSWKVSKNLTWKEMTEYSSSPSASTVKLLQSFTRQEVEKVKITLKSFKKISIFFLLQLVPIIGYIPIAIALLYPRYILTRHFWNEQQRETFLLQSWEERQNASQKIYLDLLAWNEDDRLQLLRERTGGKGKEGENKENVLKKILIQKKSTFLHNLQKITPFPYSILPTFQEKYYLVLLLQSQGIFSPLPSSTLFFFPRGFLKHRLQSHLNELLNDEYLLNRIIKRDSGKEEAGRREELTDEEWREVKISRGIHPFQENAYYLHNWRDSKAISSLIQRLSRGGSSRRLFPLNYPRSAQSSKNHATESSVSDEELLLLQIASNPIVDKSFQPPSSKYSS